MNIIRQRFTGLLITASIGLMLLGCISTSTYLPDDSTTPNQAVQIETPNPAYANAQATIDAGKSHLLELSRKATEVSLNMSQSANAAALSTQDFNRRQKMELDYQATIISIDIAQAAATQKYIDQQTKIARDATTAAQNSTATAAQSAYLLNAAQTVQVQEMVKTRLMQTGEAAAALTAYPLTATPYAVTQAALLMQKYDREQQSFLNQVVVPLIPILAAVDLVLFIAWILWKFRRNIPTPWVPRLRIAQGNLSPSPMMIDGVIVDADPLLHRARPQKLLPVTQPGQPSENTVRIEIMNAVEPPVAYWISEVEHQLADEGGLTN